MNIHPYRPTLVFSLTGTRKRFLESNLDQGKGSSVFPGNGESNLSEVRTRCRTISGSFLLVDEVKVMCP